MDTKKVQNSKQAEPENNDYIGTWDKYKEKREDAHLFINDYYYVPSNEYARIMFENIKYIINKYNNLKSEQNVMNLIKNNKIQTSYVKNNYHTDIDVLHDILQTYYIYHDSIKQLPDESSFLTSQAKLYEMLVPNHTIEEYPEDIKTALSTLGYKAPIAIIFMLRCIKYVNKEIIFPVFYYSMYKFYLKICKANHFYYNFMDMLKQWPPPFPEKSITYHHSTYIHFVTILSYFKDIKDISGIHDSMFYTLLGAINNKDAVNDPTKMKKIMDDTFTALLRVQKEYEGLKAGGIYTLKHLRQLASQRKIPNRSKMNKQQLVAALSLKPQKKLSAKTNVKRANHKNHQDHHRVSSRR